MNIFDINKEGIYKIEVSRLVAFFYFIVPLIFYGVPFFYTLDSGGVNMYFFKNFYISNSAFGESLVTHVLIGLVILLFLRVTNYEISYFQSKSLAYQILISSFFFVYLFSSFRYFSVFAFPIFIILISVFRPNGFGFSLLILISIFNLILNYNRYPMLLVIILWLLPFISRLDYKRLFFTALVGVFFLIFILQPVRAGLIPFFNDAGISDISYFVKHLYPMYIGAHVHLEYEFSLIEILSETIPLMKGFLGVESVIYSIDQAFMPESAPARLGSNTNMYFGIIGFSLVFSIFLYFGVLIRYVKNKILYSSLLMLFVIQGPFFIRRSVGSLIIDMIVLVGVVFIVSFFFYMIKKCKD